MTYDVAALAHFGDGDVIVARVLCVNDGCLIPVKDVDVRCRERSRFLNILVSALSKEEQIS